MKRGPRHGERGLTLKEIAVAEGLSVATVERVLNSGVSKLRRVPGSFSAILSIVHAVDASEHDPLQPGSVECCKRWKMLYGEGSAHCALTTDY